MNDLQGDALVARSGLPPEVGAGPVRWVVLYRGKTEPRTRRAGRLGRAVRKYKKEELELLHGLYPNREPKPGD